jgi:predicted phosphodiesterase
MKVPYPVIHLPKNYSKTVDEDKIICVSDPHSPYEDARVFDHILLNHHDTPHIHVNGDLGDFYSKSHFVNMEHENFSDELRAVWYRMEWLSANFRRVTLVKGNHDDRACKKMASMVTSDLLYLTERDVIGYLASFFDNIEVVGTQVKDPVTSQNINIGFIWQYKDIVFTHIERSQKQLTALSSGIDESLRDWHETIQLKPYRVIIQAHNHQSNEHTSGGIRRIVAPMAARLTGKGLQYVFKPALKGRPPVTGFTIIYNHNGRTDFNRTHNWLIDY